MDELRKHWDTKVTLNHKHFVGHMPDKKILDHTNRVNEHVIKQVELKPDSNVLDWGCGGGLLAKEVSKHCGVSLVDISEASLEEAQKFVGKQVLAVQVGDPEDLDVSIFPKIDLILCYSVIQHFPSYEYWQKVSAKWVEFKPKWIAVQIKVSDNIKEQENYFASRNYLNGLHIGRKHLEEAFQQYKITYWKTSIAPASGQKIAFVILKADY